MFRIARLLAASVLIGAVVAACGSSTGADRANAQSSATAAPEATESAGPQASPAPLCADHRGVKTGAGVLVNPSDGKKASVIVVCSDDTVDFQEIRAYE